MKSKIALLLLVFLALNLGAQNSDPVLMKINGQDIKKSEFEYIYRKNNTSEAIDQKDLNEYLELFKNFKLKVFEAKDHGLDTLPTFVNELAGYRRQLSQPYLEDKVTEEKYMKQAYDRMKENVKVSHILIRLPNNYTAADTLEAYNRIMEIQERVVPKNKKKKAEDFNAVAKEVSEDMSAEQNEGRLGYITAFSTVYPFESAAYNTPVGTISMPVRTSFGYHLIKVEDRRADQGEKYAAHIMVMVPQDGGDAAWDIAKVRIDSIYNAVENGLDFEEAAKKLSDDKGTAANGGQLPWFGVNRMIKEFENTAFSLKKGEVSKPFKTDFGYHIMKLNDERSLASYDDKKTEIKSMILRSDRRNNMQDETAGLLRKQFKYTPNKVTLDDLLGKAATAEAIDSAFVAGLKPMQNVLFTVDDKAYTVGQFANYLERNPSSSTAPAEALSEKYEQFVKASLFDYQDKSLEKTYPEFANLMNEYHDGILLFEISNREVWEKASKDTDGLSNYFNAHKTEYKWEKPKYKGFVISCADNKIEKDAQKLIKKLPADSVIKVLNRTFNTPEKTGVKVERVLVTQGENKAVDCFGFKTLDKKDFEAPANLPNVFVSGKILKDPESYEDVRGLVTSDYQNYLEEEWLKYLRNKYTIQVNQDVLNTIQAVK